MKTRWSIRGVALGVTLGITVPLVASAQPLGLPDTRTNGYTGGVVTAANPLAAAAGEQVLREGGNAIDAAIAVQFVLNVVEPTSSGIGGGGFMMIHLADSGETFVVDSRERAPTAATPDMYLDAEGNLIGPNFTALATTGLAVGIPGTLLGLEYALREHGSGNFSLAELIAPAIPLAEGFHINERLASLTSSSRTTVYDETRAVFRNPDGSPLEPGFFLEQPDLARTLRLIADQGPEVFYRGEIASALISAQQQYNDDVGPAGAGRMTLTDLDAYYVIGPSVREPILGAYRGYTIAGMPPPSSGGLTVMQMLKMLEQFPLGDASEGFGFGSARTLHAMIEAMRLAFADRALWMGDDDPGFPEIPREGLLADGYAKDIRGAMIDPDARMETNPEAGDPRPFDPDYSGGQGMLARVVHDAVEYGTTHFTVIDADGNGVSYTSTIEGTWGSGIMVPGYGFLLNNELTDFNLFPTASADPFNPGANDIAPFKRPRSSMAPTMVLQDGQLVAAYGSPGGSTIINSVLNITLNLIDHGMTAQEAIDAPRVSATSAGGNYSREAGFDYGAINGLVELGHGAGNRSSGIGSVQMVVVDHDTGRRFGGADDRRAGAVAGTGSLLQPSYDFATGVIDIPYLRIFDGGEDLGELRVLLLQTSDEFDFSLAGAGEPE